MAHAMLASNSEARPLKVEICLSTKKL